MHNLIGPRTPPRSPTLLMHQVSNRIGVHLRDGRWGDQECSRHSLGTHPLTPTQHSYLASDILWISEHCQLSICARRAEQWCGDSTHPRHTTIGNTQIHRSHFAQFVCSGAISERCVFQQQLLQIHRVTKPLVP